ncbi:DUF6389 family protein [Luteimonas sp. A537]
MTRSDYIRDIQIILDAHSREAASRVLAVLGLVPPKATAVTIDVHVDQDGEGFLGVRVGLAGPDLFVLNRAISPHAQLFDTRMTTTGLEPPLPLMEPLGEDFSVQDTLTDCAAIWVTAVWAQAKPQEFNLPVTVMSSEGYGTITPIKLQ